MDTIEQLKMKLSSSDNKVLYICDKFIDQRIEKERLRGAAAEQRANTLLSVVGAASAFLVFFSKSLPDTKDNTESVTLAIILFAFSALWLAKAAWYALKAINVQSRMSVTAESIFEVQEEDEIDAIKDLLAGKMWELSRAVQPNTERLFYVQRAQRALVVFIGLLLLEGIVLPFKNKLCFVDNPDTIYAFFSILFLFFIIGDNAIEKKGIWK